MPTDCSVDRSACGTTPTPPYQRFGMADTGPSVCEVEAGAEGLEKPGSVSIFAGWTMVDVDAVVTDAKGVESVALGGEILLHPMSSSFIRLR
jgi:hypothetical protein